MNIKQYLTGMLVALTVSTVGAFPPSYPEENEEVVPDTIQTSFVTKAEFDSLKAEVSLLKESYEETEGNTSGNGFVNLIWSLIFGVIGGAVTVVAVNRYLVARKQKNHANGDYESSPNKPKEASRTEESQLQKKEGNSKKDNAEVIPHTVHASAKSTSTYRPNETQRQEPKQSNPDIQESRMANTVRPTVKETPKAAQDLKKCLYGNIMIPSKGMLIIPDYALRDSENDLNFQFDLNETKGRGTYTIAPAVLKNGISSLSKLEKYVEPFEFDSDARQINVLRPGTVVHVGGENYWKVESKMVISLS